ncbi:MAG: hypothetical protein LBD95_05975 [Clostridiales Family XIII bacterium]|jgi:hypothetical protein|nr:hypothetical protein [Clostridiales Family XIII bacterium]
MSRRKFIAVLLLLCLAAPLTAGCHGNEPQYDDKGALIIPERIQTVMDRALDNVKSGGSSLNGKFAGWHRDMIASGLEHNYPRYDEQLALLDEMRMRARARNAYLLYDYDAESDAYLISLHASKSRPLPFNEKREATHAIREAFAGRGSVEMFAWEYEDDDPVWSAFMPIYDENAEIVAVLGLDRIAIPVLDFPEWNRDSGRWNGLTE